MLVAPDVPGLDEALAEAIVGDLADGCTAIVGRRARQPPVPRARSHADPGRPELAARAVEGGAIAAARARRRGPAGRQLLGLLRSERRLASAADARALALDPLVPPELAALLAVSEPSDTVPEALWGVV